MIDYRLALAQRGTTGLGTVIEADVLNLTGVPEKADLIYTDGLNDAHGGTLEFSVPLDHTFVTKANFQLGNREVHLYRNEGSGDVLVWGGKLWKDRVEDWTVRFIAWGWWWDLARREHRTSDYNPGPRDQFDILRDLVDATQAETGGALGITHFNTVDSGVNRTILICVEERRKLGSVAEELAAATNGIDFAVLPDKKLRLWSPRRGVASGITFNDSNLSAFGYDEDAENLNTQVAAVGPRTECSIPDIYEASDSGALTTFGLLQSNLQLSDVRDQSHREKIADEHLRVTKVSRYQPTVRADTDLQGFSSTPVGYSAVQVGDTCTLTVVRGPAGGFGNISASFRCIERKVFVRPPGYETIEYTLDQVVT